MKATREAIRNTSCDVRSVALFDIIVVGLNRRKMISSSAKSRVRLRIKYEADAILHPEAIKVRT